MQSWSANSPGTVGATDESSVAKVLDFGERVIALAFSPNVQRLAAAKFKEVGIWDLDGAKATPMSISPEGIASFSTSVAFSPDGKRLAVGLSNERIGILNALSYECVANLVPTFERAIDSYVFNIVAFSKQGDFIVSEVLTDESEDVRHWDPTTKEILWRTGPLIQPLNLKDNRRGMQLTLSDITATWGIIERIINRTVRHQIAKGGDWLAAGQENVVRVFSITDGNRNFFDIPNSFQNSASIIVSIAFSPDRRLIATGASDGSVTLYSAEQRKYLTLFTGHTDAVDALAFSPDGTKLASGARDGSIRIWKIPPTK